MPQIAQMGSAAFCLGLPGAASGCAWGQGRCAPSHPMAEAPLLGSQALACICVISAICGFLVLG